MTNSLTRTIFEGAEEGSTGIFRILGLWNGITIGLGVALGVWGLQAVKISRIPVQMPYHSMIVAGLLVVLICTLTGWLSAVVNRTLVTVLAWLVAGVLIALVISLEANQIRSTIVWLVDSRFWGRSIYQDISFESPFLTLVSQVLSGFFLLLLLTVLAIMQEYRLEGLLSSLSERHFPTVGTFMRFFFAMILVAVTGLITANMIGAGGPAQAFEEVHEVIQTGRDYEGDLYELSLAEGLNYNAIRGVRDQLDGDYRLTFGGFDPAAALTIIVADFESGVWINCRSLGDQLDFCGDASPPYTIGFRSLITGELPPEDCYGCLPAVDDNNAAWLRERSSRLGSDPQIHRVVQQGNYVLMRAESDVDDYAIECWFVGNLPVTLDSCEEITE